jgi:hypothetical protein
VGVTAVPTEHRVGQMLFDQKACNPPCRMQPFAVDVRLKHPEDFRSPLSGYIFENLKKIYKFGKTVLRYYYSFIRRHDIQHDDTQHNAIQHNDIQNNNTQHNDTQHNDTQHCNK